MPLSYLFISLPNHTQYETITNYYNIGYVEDNVVTGETRLHQCAQEIESPYNRSKDALMSDDEDRISHF